MDVSKQNVNSQLAAMLGNLSVCIGTMDSLVPFAGRFLAIL